MQFDFSVIKFDAQGLVPAVAQDIKTGKVLMLAYMNREAIEQTIATKLATYFSRSRSKLWVKGEESGHYQKVVALKYDCDGDAVLLQVEQTGNACHTGEYSCFHNIVVDEQYTADSDILNELYDVISDRKQNPKDGSYTCYLFNKGTDKICKKVGEEASEVIIAAKNGSSDELRCEVADLFYHCLVLMVNNGITVKELYQELRSRR